jgi:predicted HTH domain antitoxin
MNNMGDVLSLRMDEQLNEIVNDFIKEQKLEKSEAVRQLIVKGVYLSAIQDYLEQKISIQKAAAICKIPLSEFMDFLGKLGIGSQLELDDIMMGYDNLIRAK